MGKHSDIFWKIKIENCKNALEKNNFTVFPAKNVQSAKTVFFKEILPTLNVQIASWGDSQTFLATGVLEEIRQNPDIRVIETFDQSISAQERLERRRRALLSDLFFTGANAVTEKGQLVNLDMVGNRVGAITFGPKSVVLFIGRNKIVPNLDAAMKRVKNYAAPLNAIRHEYMKTPCRKTASCMDCHSPDRICNYWAITEKSFPKGRINIVLINQDLGL